MSTSTTASVSTHILDTSVGRPAEGVAVRLSARSGQGAPYGQRGEWLALGGSVTDADGRCKDLPALPEGTTHVRLDFAVEAYFERSEKNQAEKQVEKQAEKQALNEQAQKKQAETQQDAPAHRDSGAAEVFFPEVAITFAVRPGEHYHVPLLLNPFGYSVYRGS